MGNADNSRDSAYYQAELGKLLQKSRTPENTRLVDEVLQSDRSLEEKISEIEKIDRPKKKSSVSDLKRMHRTSETSEDTSGTPVKTGFLADNLPYDQDNFRDIAQNRSRIKNHLERKGFWNFLFRDMKRIRKFGETTHTLNTALFSLQALPNRDVRISFSGQLQKKAVPETLAACDAVLEVGWKHLTKKQYNLVGLFRSFLAELERIDFNRLDYRNRNLIDSLDGLERLFYSLHSHPEYQGLILEAVRETAAKEPEAFSDNQDPSRHIRGVLLKDISLPSLYNFLLGLNMVKYRRYLGPEDLIRRDPGPVISNREFDCSPEVREKIIRYVRECEEQLTTLSRQWESILRLKAFIPSGETGVDTSFLQEFYNRFQERHGSSSFEKDRERTFEPTFGILDIVLREFRPLLIGQIRLKGFGTVRVFSRRFFETDLEKLALAYKKLERISIEMPSFPRKRFLILKESRKGAIANEAAAMQIIDETFSTLGDMANKTALLLRTRLPGSPPGDSVTPLDPLVLQGKPFHLPYGDAIIVSEGLLGGKTVTEALTTVCSICYLSSIYFRNHQLTTLLNRERKVQEKIEKITHTLYQLLNPEAFKVMKETYNLPG